MDLETASECNTTANFTGNFSSCPQPLPAPPAGPIINPYNEFSKFAFGSAIYMIIISFINIVANGLLLLVFFFDPLKIFRNATTYFLIGIAFADIFIAATQTPMFSTCFLMMYIRHPNTVKTCTSLLNIGQTMLFPATNASFLVMLAFTVTQYIVVISPLNHARKVTKTRVIICVLAIYAYVILFSLSPEIGVPRDIQQKIDNTFHSIALVYLTIIFHILLYIAFRKKMAASKSLQEDQNKQGERRNDRQTGVERKFIIVNFLLVAILFLTYQPSALLWIIRLYSNEDADSPNVLITNLWVDNVLYLKFLLDPFVYAWRIPKYRFSLRIMLRCGRQRTRSKPTTCEHVMTRRGMSRKAAVIALDLKRISPK